MPTYCYRVDGGERIIERVFPMGKAPRAVKLPNDMIARRDFAAEHVGVPALKGWPIECLGSGVNANQAGELRKHLKDRGCATEVSGDGNPIYRDPAHRKKALKARGLCDKSSYS